MIPSRGLRWSSQTIGIGRRRIEAVSARQFSSSPVLHSSIRANGLLSKNRTIAAGGYGRFGFERTNTLIRNGGVIRFASTVPASISSTAPSTTAPSELKPEAISSSTTPSDFTTSLDSATDFTSDSLHSIPETIGYLHSLGLDYGYGPTAGMEWILEHVHIYAGTPWWVSISLTAILIRAALFKPYVDAAENATKMQVIAPITKPITAKMQDAARQGNNELTMQLRGELQTIYRRAGVKMWKSFVPMVQVFAGYGTFVLLRAMSNLPVPGLETGGALWFYNLAIPDPFYLLPLATAGVLHWVLRKGGETATMNMSPEIQKAMIWGLPFLSLVFTSWLPASVQLSFFVAGLCSYIQSTLFRQPWFRSSFNMTPLPTRAPPGSTPALPPSPYKGTMKIAANPVLSSKELSGRFEAAEEKKMAKKGVLGGVLGEVTGTFKGLGSKAKEQFNKQSDNGRAKQKVKEAKAYEEKRRREIEIERKEEARRRSAERAARRLQK